MNYTLSTYYSKSVNQEQVVNFTNVNDSKQGWIEQGNYQKDDLTDIKSLYFQLSNIVGSDGSAGLAPGDYIVLDWKMDAPVGAPTNEVAWNSFAIQATEVGAGNDEGSKMLPTAPNKVGFLIHPNNEHVPLGEIGNFVWFDSNRDGTQDEEYPGDSGQGAGINGITVNLYKAGETTPFKSSKTGYHYNGSPGYYLFQGLEAGNYFVEFVLPDRYMPTTANVSGADPSHTNDNDSNLVTKGATVDGYTPYRTDTISLGTAGKIPTIDLGLIETASPTGGSYPSITFEKEITSVTQGSSTIAPSQQYVVVGNDVHYKLSLKNTSSVTLHNFKISDALDRLQAGFEFTKLTYNGEEIALNSGSHDRPDIIGQLVSTARIRLSSLKIWQQERD